MELLFCGCCEIIVRIGPSALQFSTYIIKFSQRFCRSELNTTEIIFRLIVTFLTIEIFLHWCKLSRIIYFILLCAVLLRRLVWASWKQQWTFTKVITKTILIVCWIIFGVFVIDLVKICTYSFEKTRIYIHEQYE